jgi:hypothetical protein
MRGKVRWSAVWISARNDSGKVVKWYGTNTDLEDRKRAEDALRSNEQSLRLIQRNSGRHHGAQCADVTLFERLLSQEKIIEAALTES